MHDHSNLIDKLGGGTGLAVAIWGAEGSTPRKRDVVYKWKRNGVPHRWRPLVAKLARQKRVQLPKDFFPGHEGGPSLVGFRAQSSAVA